MRATLVNTTDLATTLTGLPPSTPLFVDVAPSSYADEIWLMSAQAPGYAPWLIYVQKVGGHDALASELKGVLESRPIYILPHQVSSLREYCGIKIKPRRFPTTKDGSYVLEIEGWPPLITARDLYEEFKSTPVAQATTQNT